MHKIEITNPVLIDLTEARLFDPTPEMFDSIANDVLDRMERVIYPVFRASNTYKAVVKEDAPVLPFTPSKKYKDSDNAVTRVAPVVTGVTKSPSSELLSARASQEALDAEIKNQKKMLKKIERHARKSLPPMSPEELMQAMEKSKAAKAAAS